jgi:hypothetical protein
MISPAPVIFVVDEEPFMLSFHLSTLQCPDWAREVFTQAELGHVCRGHRAATIAQAMARRPGLSIPQLFENIYDVKAAYNLFDRPEATPDALQKPHRAAVARAMKDSSHHILIIEDTSELSWTNKEAIAGLGPIANGQKHQQGFLLHSALAIRWPQLPAGLPLSKRPPVEILGLADQLFHVRIPRPEGEDHNDSMARQKRPRESRMWTTIGQRLGPAPPGVRWERVCDREADIYEFLSECRQLGHGFIVRAAQDRALEDQNGQKAPQSLFSVARQAAPLGYFELELRGRKGQRKRIARLAVSSTTVRLRAPQRPGHAAGSLPAIPLTVVRVFEVNAPPTVKEPLEWTLVYDQEATTFEQALEVALRYSARWLIEEFHKALKTGLGAERLQLETGQRLFAAIAVMSIVALRLIDLREAVRIHPDASAEQSGLSGLELEVLRRQLKRPVRTVAEVALAIGRLGGHMNRKGDGLPGWITLWRGMKKLHLLVQGVLLAQDISTALKRKKLG